MASTAFAGNYAGTVVAMPLSGILAKAYGWESLFYVFGKRTFILREIFIYITSFAFSGTIGCIWFILWLIIVREGPEKDRFISSDELRYIQETLQTTGKEKLVYPWRAIFTSKAVYAIAASHFSENWGFYTLLTQLPTFLKGKRIYLHSRKYFYDFIVCALICFYPKIVCTLFNGLEFHFKYLFYNYFIHVRPDDS